MRARIGTVLVGLVATVSSLAAPAPAAESAAPAASGRPTRIMVDGDSITQGYNGDVNWRYRLWQEFRRQRVSVDMVGPRRSPFVAPGYRSARYAIAGWDVDNAAVARAWLRDMADNVGSYVATYRPDVIVIAGGLNDIRHDTPLNVVLDSLSRYVANARAVKPDVQIVVSPVLPNIDPKYNWVPGRIRQYDRLLPARVARLTTPQSPVTLAPTLRSWDERAFTWDGTHPNPLGEVHIAKRMVEGLLAARAVPGLRAPAITPVTSWQRNPGIRVTRKGSRLQLTWDGQRISYARIWLKRPGKRPKLLIRTGGVTNLKTSAFTRGKRYAVRVQLVRRKMVTPYGPATTFRAPRRR